VRGKREQVLLWKEMKLEMKRLLLVLVMVILAIAFSSPLYASSPSKTSRYDTFIMYVYQYLFPVTGKFFFQPAMGIMPISGGDGHDRLGGDADDYANGKDLIGGDTNKRNPLNGNLPGGNHPAGCGVKLRFGRE